MRCELSFSAESPLLSSRQRHELASPGANIPNASYDLLMKSTSEKLLIRTPRNLMRLRRIMQEQKRSLSAAKRVRAPSPHRHFPRDQTFPPGVKGRRSPTHPRPLRINIAPELIQFFRTTELRDKYEILSSGEQRRLGS